MHHDLALNRRGLLRAAAIAGGGLGLGSLFPPGRATAHTARRRRPLL
jgi:hypothetical protein